MSTRRYKIIAGVITGVLLMPMVSFAQTASSSPTPPSPSENSDTATFPKPPTPAPAGPLPIATSSLPKGIPAAGQPVSTSTASTTQSRAGSKSLPYIVGGVLLLVILGAGGVVYARRPKQEVV